MFRKYVAPFTGKPAPQEAIQESMELLKRSLALMERYWLKDNPYIAGNEISIADLSAACELAQTTVNPVFD